MKRAPNILTIALKRFQVCNLICLAEFLTDAIGCLNINCMICSNRPSQIVLHAV